jgi:hypothetical protein
MFKKIVKQIEALMTQRQFFAVTAQAAAHYIQFKRGEEVACDGMRFSGHSSPPCIAMPWPFGWAKPVTAVLATAEPDSAIQATSTEGYQIGKTKQEWNRYTKLGWRNYCLQVNAYKRFI